MKKTAIPLLFAICASPFMSMAAHAGQLFPPANLAECAPDNVLTWGADGAVRCAPSVESTIDSTNGIELDSSCLDSSVNQKLTKRAFNHAWRNRTYTGGVQLNLMPKVFTFAGMQGKNVTNGVDIPTVDTLDANGNVVKSVMAFSDMIIVCNNKLNP